MQSHWAALTFGTMGAIDDDELTPIICTKCNARFTFGAGRTASECPVCRGRMMNPSQWRVTQERAMTSTGLATLVRDLCDRLARQANADPSLIEEARGYVQRLESWRIEPPRDDERSRTITSVAQWHARVWHLLENKAAR
jgi:hypothetical protein